MKRSQKEQECIQGSEVQLKVPVPWNWERALSWVQEIAQAGLYCKRKNFHCGLILWVSNTHESNTYEIKPRKICTHEELGTVIMVGYSHPQKFIPLKIYPFENLTQELLWPPKFLHLR